jgi:hypothetical protein
MRCNLPASLAFVLFALAGAGPASALDPASLCWRDYPIPTPSVNYEKAFAAETLAPDPIVINGKAITTGMAEKTIDNILGMAATVMQDWEQRDDQAQCDYLLDLLREHANSMHLYKLGNIKVKKMSGLFRVVEWQLPSVGTLRAFFHKSSAAEPEKAYLLHLALVPVALDKVQRRNQGAVLTRPGSPRIEWNTEANRVRISTGSGG